MRGVIEVHEVCGVSGKPLFGAARRPIRALPENNTHVENLLA
jgi:hypothetical protein